MPSQLVAFRERLGLTQKVLASLLGKHVITISKWETGQREIDSLLPLALAEVERRITSGEIQIDEAQNTMRGEAHPQAKLDKVKVSRIKKLYKQGKTINQIARQYEVNAGTISKIVHGLTWKDVK